MAVLYFGIYGNNGVGIYTDFLRSKLLASLLSKSHLRRFDTLEEARSFAMDGYNSRQTVKEISSLIRKPEDIPVNSALVTSDIKNLNCQHDYHELNPPSNNRDHTHIEMVRIIYRH